MSASPKPTLGRIVIYTDPNGRQIPAVIAGVSADGGEVVDLHVLSPNVLQVPLHPVAKGGTWRWPERV